MKKLIAVALLVVAALLMAGAVSAAEQNVPLLNSDGTVISGTLNVKEGQLCLYCRQADGTTYTCIFMYVDKDGNVRHGNDDVDFAPVKKITPPKYVL